ncbi:MAG: type II toxin-antitoxin system TacA family antitoxin [Rhodoferax sp.]
MPSTAPRTESAYINLRASREVKALIERAASLTGATVSSFISLTMFEASSRIVNQLEQITLSQEAFKAFADACGNPPEPSPPVIKAACWPSQPATV